MATTMGLDIGYSNVKLVYMDDDENYQESVFPVGVSTLEQFNRQVKGVSGGNVDSTVVLVDGIEYATGINPGKIVGSARDVSESYTKTPQYKALFYTALLYAETNQIDKLVTGLPVSHWQNEELKEEIRNMMLGEHQIAKKRSITVKSVEIIPQPAGAFMDAISYSEEMGNHDIVEDLSEGSVIIIDPGFYSTDWVVFEGNELNAELSGTTLQATSRIIDRVAELISNDYGAAPGKGLKSEKIEATIRANKHIVRHSGQKIDIDSYVQKSSKEVSESAMSEIAGSMRNAVMDTVVIAGGGGRFFAERAAEVFPQCNIVQTDNPVLSIARGYHQWASR